MAKDAFETRFLGGVDISSLRVDDAPSKINAAEATAESLFNRSAKLGALLGTRLKPAASGAAASDLRPIA